MIPGEFIALLTFPGVIVHEIAHQLFCRICRVAVFDVCYFRWGNPAGYVIHEKPRTINQQILIGIGPFLVNTLFAALIAFPAAIPVMDFDSGNFLDYLLMWLGVSIAMHAFPSTVDANTIWQAVKNKQTPLLVKILTAPLVGLIYLGAVGSMIWLDLFYGVGVIMLGPQILVNVLAGL